MPRQNMYNRFAMERKYSAALLRRVHIHRDLLRASGFSLVSLALMLPTFARTWKSDSVPLLTSEKSYVHACLTLRPKAALMTYMEWVISCLFLLCGRKIPNSDNVQGIYWNVSRIQKQPAPSPAITDSCLRLSCVGVLLALKAPRVEMLLWPHIIKHALHH